MDGCVYGRCDCPIPLMDERERDRSRGKVESGGEIQRAWKIETAHEVESCEQHSDGGAEGIGRVEP